MDSVVKGILRIKPPSTDCKEFNFKDLIIPTTDLNEDQPNKTNFLMIGKHENQLSEGGEIDLHKHRKNCEKNPGHQGFIPIDSFSLEHLPDGYRDSDLHEFIKAAADLTVRIGITMTSPHRPEFWPKTKIPYFLYDMRGQKTFRSGSGRMSGVKKFTDEDKHNDHESCPCEQCKTSNKPSEIWWKIVVDTATHVVFDDTEASHTNLRLFYDREKSPLVILKDHVRIVYVDVEEDRCEFTCVTCDESLANGLEKMLKRFDDAREKVKTKYKDSRDIHKLNFIVSHPHGCSKQVSVGQWKDKVEVAGDHVGNHRFTYTTCTCPGSSGAYVHCLGYGDGWLNDHVHSGSLESGLNHSGLGRVM